MNLFRARTAIDAVSAGDVLEIWLGVEGSRTVPTGLSALGHLVVAEDPRESGLRLVMRRGGAQPQIGRTDEDRQRRFARQIVLPDFGEAGQRGVAESEVLVVGAGEAAATATMHLKAAGVGSVIELRDAAPGRLLLTSGSVRIERPARDAGALARFEGTVAADALLRAIVSGIVPTSRIDVSDEGVVRTVAVAP